MNIQMAESISDQQQAHEVSPEKSTTINLDKFLVSLGGNIKS